MAGAVNGTVMLSKDKATVTFTHDGSETSSGSFTYTVSDGTATDTATVTITVTAANDAPVASDDTATVAEGGSVDIAASTLLANDSDPEKRHPQRHRRKWRGQRHRDAVGGQGYCDIHP